MDVKKLTISFGLVTTTILWETFGNKGVGYISNKIREAGQALKANSAYTDWFKPDYIIGVTLASQIFITACGGHSPIVNFAEKSVVGLVYYIPTVLIYEGGKNVVSSFSFVNTDLVKPIAGVVSVLGGGVLGGFTQNQISNPLHKVALNTDIVAKSIGAILFSTFNLLIGNAKAENVEEHSVSNVENIDASDIETFLSGEGQMYNSTLIEHA